MSPTGPSRSRAALVCLLIGCGGDPERSAVDPLRFDVREPGPWRVGLHLTELTYEPLPGETRTIGVNVWYPTDAEQGEELAFLDIDAAEGTFADAEPIAPPWRGGFPVLAYSHGDRAYGGSSADLMKYFASHGWVAVAPDHTDNLLIGNVEPTPQGHWYHRPLDVQAAVDLLDDLGWLGPVDTDRYVVSGHSRGTTTVWSLLDATFAASRVDHWCPGCSDAQLDLFDGPVADPRIAGGITLAGTFDEGFFGLEGFLTVGEPVLSMTGSADPVGQEEQWEQVTLDDLLWVDLEGGCHQTFALGVCGTLDPELGYHLVDTYSLAFARRWLLGDDSRTVAGLLDGSLPLDPAVHLSHR